MIPIDILHHDNDVGSGRNQFTKLAVGRNTTASGRLQIGESNALSEAARCLRQRPFLPA